MSANIFHTTPDREIVSTRIFNATQQNLFQAWANPQYLKKWWGPKGFINTFNEFDFRVGGKWSFIMHGPEKGNYANECEFVEIIIPSLIAWKRHSKPLFQVVASFEEINHKQTKLVFKMIFDTAEECEKLKPFVVDKNEENFDKLEDVLLSMKA
ncbi:SRPBCC family protein [Pedobacter glucosidilyticus]|uniref:SRPBCC family protein n=1 Tax=Pedobacter glucosidilyticus TaxID=1122941 RepID=UPI0026EBD61B|nr:SRPBCC family protein [Pedobacter glucosidilyticus]